MDPKFDPPDFSEIDEKFSPWQLAMLKVLLSAGRLNAAMWRTNVWMITTADDTVTRSADEDVFICLNCQRAALTQVCVKCGQKMQWVSGPGKWRPNPRKIAHAAEWLTRLLVEGPVSTNWLMGHVTRETKFPWEMVIELADRMDFHRGEMMCLPPDHPMLSPDYNEPF